MDYLKFYNYLLSTDKPFHIKTMGDGGCEIWLYDKCIKAFDSNGNMCKPSGLPYF